MEKDTLIVGGGIAGCTIAFQLEGSESFDLTDNHLKDSATLVAAGMINPMVFRRMIPCWRANDFLKKAVPFYRNLEDKLGTKLLYRINLAKVINNENEKKLWREACVKEDTRNFLNPSFITDKYRKNIHVEQEIGEVKEAYQLKTGLFLEKAHEYFKSNSSFLELEFCHADLILKENGVEWKGRKYKRVIFCEGMGITKNPYFNHLPFKPTKGEFLEIESDVDFKHTIKKNIFIHPEGGKKFWVGATYDWENLTSTPSEKGKNELITKLNNIAKFDYTITNQIAGVRPTVRDRRPYIGKHPQYTQLFVMNGLGTRGVLMAPMLAEELISSFNGKDTIHPEVLISRISQELEQ